MDLIVGATGILGQHIFRNLLATERSVRALVRTVSEPDRVALIQAAATETVVGDLKDSASLAAACAGIDTVVSSATCTLARAEGDSVDSVDRDGQVALVEAARAAGVKHFVFVSFPVEEAPFPLQTAKRAVEKALMASGMTYTILRPPHFNESWLGPRLGLEAKEGKVRLFGDGSGPVSWIRMEDVARATVAAVGNPKAANLIIPIGGPEALPQTEVITRFEKAAGRPFTRDAYTMADIEAAMASDDPVMKSIFTLMLACANHGCVIDNTLAKETLGHDPRTVDDHIAASLKD